MSKNTMPTHGVFVVEGEGDNAFWTRIGAAWAHGDGKGFNISLSAVPLTGRLVLRERNEKEEGR
ncbi:hypothetical protein [Aureimonas phyllosphaerae]|uniref:Uncharacterized protein n=1 Tax=Aureimonas phyllosphaerae TaxID=1166078 RepID=A0A7W6FWE0_9HYPH|nr:hypothetical protein [Aureimonas phyllosphaerae]MBB3938086.1 hypothetical protein [Aureimonas phyllosphaerae]MBB3962093.1 hypothetical protein [Aureimonas phyllosphaerae]SFF56040.1 hypothetical protein SAMN05216566_12835 [Aureimonas phyllosphaerae]